MLHFGFQNGKLVEGVQSASTQLALSNSQNYLSSARSSFSTSGQKRFFMNTVLWLLPPSIAFPMDTFSWLLSWTPSRGFSFYAYLLPLGLYRVLQSLKPSKPSIK